MVVVVADVHMMIYFNAAIRAQIHKAKYWRLIFLDCCTKHICTLSVTEAQTETETCVSFNSTREKLDTRADVCKRPSVDDDAVT